LCDDLAGPTGEAIQLHRCNLGPLELLGSFFLGARWFHSVCFFFSPLMHGRTLLPLKLNVSAGAQFRSQLHGTTNTARCIAPDEAAK
jgi:hypothetical protein